MVPWITVPFFSSICTVSLVSFIKNLCAAVQPVLATCPVHPDAKRKGG